MKNSRSICCVAILLVVALHWSARAAEHDLASVMPRDVLLYAGWAGAEAGSATPRNDALSKIMKEPQVQRCVQSLSKQFKAFANQELAKEGMEGLFDTVATLLGAVWKYPAAFSVLDVGFSDMGPDVQLALLVRSGAQSGELIQQFERLLQQSELPAGTDVQLETGQACKSVMFDPMAPPLYYAAVGDYVLITLGRSAFSKMVASIRGGPHLIEDADFADARKKLKVDRERLLLQAYVNMNLVVARFKKIFPLLSGATQDEVAQVDESIDALGLDGIRSMSYVSQNSGGGFQGDFFIHTAGARKGLLQLFAQKSIEDRDLSVIPADATLVSAFNFDLAKAYDQLLTIAADMNVRPPPQADPRAEPAAAGPSLDIEQMLRGALGMLDGFLGFRVKEDVLDALGDTFVFFDAPSNGGFLITGWTLVIDIRDQEKIKTALANIVSRISQFTSPDEVGLKSYKYGDHDIHFVNVVGVPMPLAPAWSITGERLVVGFYPQMVINVLDRLERANPRESILANEDFIRGRRHLPAKLISLSYVDTKKGVSDMYSIALPLLQMASAMGQAEGLDVDISLLPNRDAITRHLFGDVQGCYVDEQGIRVSTHGPLPLALPSVGGGGAASTAVLVSILLPSLARARELARATVSGTNLREVGRGISKCIRTKIQPISSCYGHFGPNSGHLRTDGDQGERMNLYGVPLSYSFDNHGHYPADLHKLVESGYLAQNSLRSPSDEGSPPGTNSYVYIRQRESDDARNILAYERPENNSEQIPVLLNDGHVETVAREELERLLEATAGRLGDRFKKIMD